MEKKLNFNSIKKLTRQGGYTIDVPLEDLKHTIDRYVKKHNLQMTPNFKRGHVWSEEQQIKFVEFILCGGKTHPIYFNHTNWMSLVKKDSEMICVDGLQRITALLKFVDDELSIFGGYKLTQIEDINIWEFHIQINVNNLKTREEILQWYIDINVEGTPHTYEEIEKVKLLLNK